MFWFGLGSQKDGLKASLAELDPVEQLQTNLPTTALLSKDAIVNIRHRDGDLRDHIDMVWVVVDF